MLVAVTVAGGKVLATQAPQEAVCPDCGRELVARRPARRVWHFSHKPGDGTPCRASRSPAARRARSRALALAAAKALEAHRGQGALFDLEPDEVPL